MTPADIFRNYEKQLDRAIIRKYKKPMKSEWDALKNAKNMAKHDLDFADFQGWDAEPIVVEDTRFDYGETRFIALGRIGGAPHSLVYTMRGEVMRIISFRRAHEEEIAPHERPEG